MEITNIKQETWHPQFTIKSGDFNCTLKSNPGGCGSLLLYGWSGGGTKDNIIDGLTELLKIISNKNGFIKEGDYGKKIDVGAISTVVGKRYYGKEFEQAILQVGFKEVAIYPNPRHGKGYTQKFYIWTKP